MPYRITLNILNNIVYRNPLYPIITKMASLEMTSFLAGKHFLVGKYKFADRTRRQLKGKLKMKMNNVALLRVSITPTKEEKKLYLSVFIV